MWNSDACFRNNYLPKIVHSFDAFCYACSYCLDVNTSYYKLYNYMVSLPYAKLNVSVLHPAKWIFWNNENNCSFFHSYEFLYADSRMNSLRNIYHKLNIEMVSQNYELVDVLANDGLQKMIFRTHCRQTAFHLVMKKIIKIILFY